MIRPYQADDEDQVINVWRIAAKDAHSFLSEKFLETEEGNIRKEYLPATKNWVFEQDGKIVGFISLIDNEIGGLFVMPQHHGQGIGTSLIDATCDTSSDLRVNVFKRNQKGVEFYKKYGFKIDRTFLHKETGEEMYEMLYG